MLIVWATVGALVLDCILYCCGLGSVFDINGDE